ncbi:MAG: AMP-binding protein, partial [Oxalobacteraceae bacterium]
MTFPRLLLQHAQTRPGKPAYREKDLGIWQTWNWMQVNEEVRALACGLAAQGFQRGMHLAIVGDNRPRLYWAMMAAQCLGGIAVPLYQDAPAADMAYVLENAEISFVVVEDQEQVDKLMELKTQYPGVAHIVFEDERGMRHYAQPELISYRKLQELGREFDRAHPTFFVDAVNAGRPEDVAVMLYTSGTTGKPKGVCQTHAALIAAAAGGASFDHLTENEDILSYL